MPDSRLKLLFFTILSGASIWGFIGVEAKLNQCEKCRNESCFLDCLDGVESVLFYVYLVLFLIVVYTLFAHVEKCLFRIKKKKFEALVEEIM